MNGTTIGMTNCPECGGPMPSRSAWCVHCSHCARNGWTAPSVVRMFSGLVEDKAVLESELSKRVTELTYENASLKKRFSNCAEPVNVHRYDALREAARALQENEYLTPEAREYVIAWLQLRAQEQKGAGDAITANQSNIQNKHSSTNDSQEARE